MSTMATLRGLVCALASLLLLTLAAPVGAQMNLSVDPMMTRGPASAPVTIVEFSDYQ